MYGLFISTIFKIKYLYKWKNKGYTLNKNNFFLFFTLEYLYILLKYIRYQIVDIGPIKLMFNRSIVIVIKNIARYFKKIN